ncbi:hypothetical protein GBF38_022769 [Nibea albiflora]|uniref:Uncharacterized protein n=1 Tax=Nibea albiflora TaxID=240163 RepID=A0ACB7EXU9_NIBAL|nr:hypothetical protein GBF38_022769 [Nibea albiflora]
MDSVPTHRFLTSRVEARNVPALAAAMLAILLRGKYDNRHQASSPPELRVIGSDISMPAPRSADAAKHKEAQRTEESHAYTS